MVNLDINLLDNIKTYCELNNKDLDYEINDMLKIGFSIKKYGNSPFQKMKEQMGKPIAESIQEDKNIAEEKTEEKPKENIKKENNQEKPVKKIRVIKNK